MFLGLIIRRLNWEPSGPGEPVSQRCLLVRAHRQQCRRLIGGLPIAALVMLESFSRVMCTVDCTKKRKVLRTREWMW